MTGGNWERKKQRGKDQEFTYLQTRYMHIDIRTFTLNPHVCEKMMMMMVKVQSHITVGMETDVCKIKSGEVGGKEGGGGKRCHPENSFVQENGSQHFFLSEDK